MNKRLIEKILKARDITKMQVAMKAAISLGDFYQALNGKKPFFPAWCKRLAKALNVSEEYLFPNNEREEN